MWSALEYTAHLRDALAWYGARIHRVLAEPTPQLAGFDFRAACESRAYNDDPPDVTRSGLREAGEALAGELRGLDTPQWERVGLGSDGSPRTVATLARRAAHEASHHLVDVQKVLAGLDPSAGR